MKALRAKRAQEMFVHCTAARPPKAALGEVF
jgi:hypothetical protein